MNNKKVYVVLDSKAHEILGVYDNRAGMRRVVLHALDSDAFIDVITKDCCSPLQACALNLLSFDDIIDWFANEEDLYVDEEFAAELEPYFIIQEVELNKELIKYDDD